ncbi:MAG: shikimate kinase AroK [Legionellales bacterium]|nr:shikimate kinase AroK [Legionellales bacterium]
MNKKQNVFLVGPMGAGKTTVGRFLADELKRDFYDSDHEVEERTGVDIAWIFDVEGEAGFREREVAAIEDLTQLSGIVLATGGGAILRPENRKSLSSRGIVIYLQTDLEEQFKRTERDKKRPLLQTENKEQRIRDLHQQRHPLYQEIADYTFETNSQTVKAVANEILAILLQKD